MNKKESHREILKKFKEPAIECMKKNSTKNKEVVVECNGTTKKLTTHYAIMFEDPEVFSECILEALADVDKNLNAEEKKAVDESMEKIKKIYDKIKKMEGGSSNSTNTGSGN
ncbi:hypothetical protein TNCV_189711 [Trichonephila clavipes]|nr:hypothetical protein TNCV_189711 [Trichonephila clavipes]